MPMYEFYCKKCGLTTTTLSRTTPVCQVCEHPTVRRFSFNTPKLFTPHYNVSVGRYVTSQSDFNNALKEKAAEQEARTGIATTYVPIEAGDREAFGVTDEGRDNWERERHNSHVSDPFLESITND